jgi:hypothetical protein
MYSIVNVNKMKPLEYAMLDEGEALIMDGDIDL